MRNCVKIEHLDRALKKTEAEFVRGEEGKSIWIETPPLKNMALVRKKLMEISRFFAANGYEVRYYAKELDSE